MYINIGAYVGDGTLIDSHALVGSCAQIGARVHLSAAAQIGGVLEPVGALPVIIEDDVLVGGNCGVYEGAIVKRRAVLAAGTILTGSTPVYDLPNERIIEPVPGQPLIVPEGAVVVPGRAPITDGHRARVGPVARDAGHREVPRRADRHAHGARSMDPVETVAFAARAHRHRFDDRPRARGGRWLAGVLRDRGYAVVEQPLARGCCERARDARRARRSCSRRTSTACRRSFPAGVEDGRAVRPRRVRRQGHSRGAGRGGRAAARQRRTPRRPAVRRRRGARQRRRRAGEPSRLRASRFLINGEPTDNRLGRCDARRAAAQAARTRPRGALGVSRARRLGDRQADRRADAAADTDAAPETTELGATHYTIGLIEGGVAPNVVSPHASAEVLFRTVGPADDVLEAIRPLASTVEIEEVLRVPPVRAAHGRGLRFGGVLLHHRRPAARRVGHAAAVRARFDSSSRIPTRNGSISTEMAGAIEIYERLARKLLLAIRPLALNL